jgi:hypothetical protein
VPLELSFSLTLNEGLSAAEIGCAKKPKATIVLAIMFFILSPTSFL